MFTIGHADADETRASLASEDGKTLIAWDNNDAIGTRAGAYDGFSHVLVSGGIASFSVYSTDALAIGDHIYCYFPYSGSIQSIDNIAMSIPDSQTMDSDGFDVRAMPMVSIPYEVTTSLERSGKNSAVDVINFVNLASLIDFRIYTSNAAYGAEKIEWVQFESSAICGDFNFTGAKSVDYANPNTMAIPTVTGTTIKTSFTTPETVGGTKDNAVHAYMVVAPGSHSGTVTVKTNVATYTYVLSAKEYKRSSLKPLSVDLNNAANREAPAFSIYEKVTSAPTDWEGSYLIATVDGTHIATGIVADKHISSTSVTPNSDGSISCSDENSLFFHKESSGYYSIKNSSGKYISWTSSVNIAEVASVTDNNALFSLSLSGTNALIQNVGAGTRFIRWNGSSDFRMYTPSNGSDVVLYKKAESRVLTSITLSGTYPTSFYKGDSFTYDGLIVTAHYDNETQRVVTPTSVSVPDLSQIANDVPVTVTYTEGDVTKTASYTVSVIARPVYTVTLADDNTELTAELGGSVSLPSRSVEGYTFEGWSVTEISQPTTTAPELIQVGSYSPTASITLYPVFSSGENTTVWAKTALDALTAGTYVLVSFPNNYAFNGTISSGHGQKTSTAINFDTSGRSTSIPNDACLLELIPVSEGFKLYNSEFGYLYASKASSGGLAWHENEGSYWYGDKYNSTILYKANTAHLRCYNDTFRTYASNSNDGIALAKQTTIVSKTYISNPE